MNDRSAEGGNMRRPNATKFCDELKFNRFHWALLLLGGLTLIFDGYDSQIFAYVMPNVIREWHLSPVGGDRHHFVSTTCFLISTTLNIPA